MQEALADFRVESDAVVWLAFANGATYRVSPDDLERYVLRADLVRIRRAITLRRQFIRQVLPPTAMVLLLAGIIGLGSHDMQRVQALAHPKVTPAVHCVPAKMMPTSASAGAAAPATATQAAAPASGFDAASGGVAPAAALSATDGGIGRTMVPVTGGRASGSGVTHGAAPVVTQLPAGVGAATAPVTQTVQGLVTPVTQTVRPVTQAVAPVTNAAGHLLGGL